MVAPAGLRAWMAGGEAYFPALEPHLGSAFAAWRRLPSPARGEDFAARAERNLEDTLADLGGMDAFAFLDAGFPENGEGALPAPARLAAECADDLEALFVCARLAAKSMVSRKVPGSLIAVVDVCGLAGRPSALSAAVTSGAAVGLVKSLAKELGRYGIRANAICYGRLEGFPERTLRPEEQKLMQATGNGTVGSPAALAAALGYLASPGSHVTGQVLSVDGGLVI